MGNEEETGSDESSGTTSAKSEKDNIRPDTGFVLASIDMMKPPGEALTKLNQSLVLSDLSLPQATELTDYVIYDGDGNDYGHSTLKPVSDRIEEEQYDKFFEDLQADPIRDQRVALYGLTKLADEDVTACLDAVPLVASQLQSPKLDVQAAALDVLVIVADSHPDEVTPAATEVVSIVAETSEPHIRKRAIQYIAKVADRSPATVMDAAPTLAGLLSDDPPAKSTVLLALRRIAEVYPDAVAPAASDLLDYVETGDGTARINAIAVVGMIAKKYPDVAESTIPVATHLLTAERHKLRANAAGLLADLAAEFPEQISSSVPQVIELLDDDDEKVRYNATSILARVAKDDPSLVEPATDHLIESLDEEFPYTRANVSWALGYIEAEQSLSALETLAKNDPNDEVRDAASYAISEIRSDE